MAGDITIVVGAQLPTVRSAYLEQVKRIAPPDLLDRDAELAELAGFCLDADGSPYVWWQAGPWAGKSALLSTFVVRPPTQLGGRVCIVSFFITARLAAQDTREAFTTVLLEQLCALTGQDMPAGLGEATREGYLLALLGQTAAACRAAGRWLVLVLDGLDEDRGVTAGPEAHSIAGLLPGDPPAGMRIIVAGRPNPPIPSDVPDWHPLRDPGIIRVLPDSPHARDLHRLGQTELRRLLRGSRVEQDLLGLLTAARGGLSGSDLHELAGADLVLIEDVLHTVAGRTFARRVASWTPATGPEVYLLGHEELHNAAVQYLGAARLAEYQQRLHAWADTYRAPSADQQSWPPGTPEYLLRGYGRMLAATDEIGRLVALATDPARHDRMLDLSGGDAAALVEITTAQDLLLARHQPDLLALARLSIHRQRLESRNDSIPSDLPAVWVLLGRSARAEALARSITDPHEQTLALVGLAQAVAATGEFDRAEALARSVTDLDEQAWALAEVARAVAAAGQRDRAMQLAVDAEQIARDITYPDQQAQALAEVARAVAAAGQRDRAMQLATDAEKIARDTPAYSQTLALARVARAVAAAGQRGRARRLAIDTEQVAHTVTGSYPQAWAQAAVVLAVAAADEFDRAEQIALDITEPDQQAWALAELARAVAAAGEHDRAMQLAVDAEQIARDITYPDQQAQALAEVARAVADGAGGLDWAMQLAVDAEQIARDITYPDQHARAMVELAEALAIASEFDPAEKIARGITDLDLQAWALAKVARVAATVGELSRAERLTAVAEQIARDIANPPRRAQVLAEMVVAAAAAGQLDRAEALARAITNPHRQARAIVELVETVAAAGEVACAIRLTADAEKITRSIAGLRRRAPAVAEVARAVAAAGERDRARRLATDAEELARGITDLDEKAMALAEVAGAVAAAGEVAQARRLTIDVGQLADDNTDLMLQPVVLAEVARAAAICGELQRAKRVAHSIADSRQQAQALAAIAEIADLPEADSLLGTAFALDSWWIPLAVLAGLRPELVIRIADEATEMIQATRVEHPDVDGGIRLCRSPR